MSPGRHAIGMRKVSVLLGIMVVLASLGGCPVPQVPREPSNNGNLNSGDVSGGSVINNNSFTDGSVRPIPGIPVEVDQPTDEPADGNPISDVPASTPLNVAINNFENSLNILPGNPAAIAYEVLGGNREDGEVRVTIFVDIDGVDRSGDERTLLENQPLRTIVEIPTGALSPGRYFVGVRAQNNVSTSTRYALGRLEVVGPASLTVQSPAGSSRVRPNDVLQVRATIDTIAQTVSWRLFIDVDTEFNGNEIFEFCANGQTCSLSGGGLIVQGGIALHELAQSAYHIGVEIRDSLGQRFIRYFGTVDCGATASCNTIVIDAAPQVQVTSPAADIHIQAGTQDVTIAAHVMDSEANAVVRLFRDADSSINGNEFHLASFNLSDTQGDFETTLATAGLLPGTYRLGAEVDDGAGPPVATYAPGKLVILPEPTVSGEFQFVTHEINRRSSGISNPVPVSFHVSDPARRLAHQPEGVRLNFYLDANTDWVPDSTTPVLSVNADHLNRPFGAGDNVYMLNLSTIGLPENDDLVNIIGELVLREINGNVVLSPALVSQFDDVAPQVVPFEPSVDAIISRHGGEITVSLSTIDNTPSVGIVRLAPHQVGGGPPPPPLTLSLGIFELIPPFETRTQVFAVPSSTPIGTYKLQIELIDLSDEPVTFLFAPVITITP